MSEVDVRTETEVEEEERSMAFFLLPGQAIALLHFQLDSVVGENMTNTILYKYGFRCGRVTTDQFDLEEEDLSRTSTLLRQIWMELGFGRISVEEHGKTMIRISIHSGIEAASLGYRTRPSCHFTRGYLAGMVSSILNCNVNAVEERCTTQGDESCDFIITRTVL